MSTVSQTPHRKPWEERSVVVSFLLAVLIPGLGHLYQGRVLKGLIYLVGILGLFLWGVKLGEGVVVYNLPGSGPLGKVSLHYAAQLGAGIVSYPALIQKRRMIAEDNRPLHRLDKSLKAHFTGRLKSTDNDSEGGKLDGTVILKAGMGDYASDAGGKFVGTLNGQAIELPLAGYFALDRPIAAGFQRTMVCSVAAQEGKNSTAGEQIVGSIPRPVMDGYGVPPDTKELQEVTGRLGKAHELALVFTWIAGLLNILAIWDCILGPAYGFGDEQWSNQATGNEQTGQSKSPDPVPLNKTVTSA